MDSAMEDYYKILGVDEKADADAIKKQYRRQARKYHPDLNKESGAEDNFKRSKEAYEVLKDAEKRKAYDEMRAGGFKPGQGNDGSQFYQGGQADANYDANDFSDFFNDIFGRSAAGQQQRHSAQAKGEDIHSQITISIQEAYHGTERQLALKEPMTDPQTGALRFKQKILNVKIPPGMSSGQHMRLKGKGQAGFAGGPAGDLYLEIKVNNSKQFQLEGRNVYSQVAITPWESALGADIQIPTLGGKVKMKITAGTQSGQSLRLSKRGLPGKKPGDQFVRIQIKTPLADTDEKRDFYQKMAENMPFSPRETTS